MIDVERLDAVTVLGLAHGPVNVMDLEFVRALDQAVTDASPGDAVVVTSRGRAFSAGVDLQRVLDGGPAYLDEFLGALHHMLITVFTHPRPVIAAVNGHAIAGGALLAMAADVRLMSAGRIGVPELAVGVPLPSTGLEIVRHCVGSAAMHLLTAADPFEPDEAQRLGAIDEVVAPERLLDDAIGHARRLGAVPPASYAVTKALVKQPALDRMRAAAAFDAATSAAWQSPDATAAIAARLASLKR